MGPCPASPTRAGQGDDQQADRVRLAGLGVGGVERERRLAAVRGCPRLPEAGASASWKASLSDVSPVTVEGGGRLGLAAEGAAELFGGEDFDVRAKGEQGLSAEVR